LSLSGVSSHSDVNPGSYQSVGGTLDRISFHLKHGHK
jgi:hypothetical protein